MPLERASDRVSSSILVWSSIMCWPKSRTLSLWPCLTATRPSSISVLFPTIASRRKSASMARRLPCPPVPGVAPVLDHVPPLEPASLERYEGSGREARPPPPLHEFHDWQPARTSSVVPTRKICLFIPCSFYWKRARPECRSISCARLLYGL